MRKILNNFIYIFVIAFVSNLMMTSCNHEDPILGVKETIENLPTNNGHNSSNGTEIDLTTALVNVFASNCLQTYYLWIDEDGRMDLVDKVLDPDTCLHPQTAIKKVLSPEDRWTALYENMSELIDSSNGIETTLGIDATPYLIEEQGTGVVFIVNFVYADSPAAEAGIKRGDLLISKNTIPFDIYNYRDFYYIDSTVKLGYGKYGPNGTIISAREYIELTPIHMYEEPVIATNVFDLGDKKVGYLAYTQFTEDTNSLCEAFSNFKRENISELVLDLRYNGGGLVNTAIALASMIAPREAVESEDILSTSIYNKAYTQYYKKNNIELNDRFDKKFLDYNVDIKKIYALVSSNTASASEYVLVGLNPYVDIQFIGSKTHGKFCSGIMFTPELYYDWSDEAKDFYQTYKNDFKDWGLYVMIGSFADKNGNNTSRPTGFTPNIYQNDDPFDECQLGDKEETLLNIALKQAGMKDAKVDTRTATKPSRKAIYVERPNFAIRNTPSIKKNL